MVKWIKTPGMSHFDSTLLPIQREASIVGSWAGIMEADDRQVTTVFAVQPSFIIGTLQTEYHEALPSMANYEVRCDCTFTDDGNAS